jgi:two-component system response regulator VicR
MAKHILVVNDTQDVLDAIQMVLEDAGYRVTARTEPTTSAADIEAINPDLLMIDMLFAGKNIGWELIQAIRLHEATAHLPVIVCTAARHEVTESESVLLGKGITVVYKPFDIDDLVAAVEQALSAPANTPVADHHNPDQQLETA